VVVKFIRRAKVLRESWVKDSKLGVIPMEIYLLTRLQHPNIVKVTCQTWYETVTRVAPTPRQGGN
jgi:hypothetical protein